MILNRKPGVFNRAHLKNIKKLHSFLKKYVSIFTYVVFFSFSYSDSQKIWRTFDLREKNSCHQNLREKHNNKNNNINNNKTGIRINQNDN